MDMIALFMAGTLAAIALAFVVSSVAASMQAGTGAQEKPDRQIASIKGHCSSEDCIVDAVRECRLSETTVRDASNATTIISVGGDGIYQGQPVCRVSIYEESTDRSAFQSWSCKVPVAELQDYAGNSDGLVGMLTASEHCALQIP